jgi:hypothetical protein
MKIQLYHVKVLRVEAAVQRTLKELRRRTNLPDLTPDFYFGHISHNKK